MRKILFAMMMICFIMNSGFQNESKSAISASSIPKTLNKRPVKTVMVDIMTEDIQITHAYRVVFRSNNNTGDYGFDVLGGNTFLGQIPEGSYTVSIFTKLAVENPPAMFFWLGHYGEGSYIDGIVANFSAYVSNESNNMVGILPQ